MTTAIPEAACSALEGSTFLLVQPKDSKVDAIEWAKANREFIEPAVLKHGGIVFRGFNTDTPERFDAFVKAFGRDPAGYKGGASPGRDKVAGDTYTSTKFSKDGQIPFHNEMSYVEVPPRRIWFCCKKAGPSDSGGQTPICDAREVLQKLDPTLVDTLKQRGIRYVRRYHDAEKLGLDAALKACPNAKSWQDAFGVTTREELDAALKELNTTVSWEENGVYMVTAGPALPPTRKHPTEGDEVWFCQLPLWDPRAAVVSVFAGEANATNFSGDGGRNPDGEKQIETSDWQELFAKYGLGCYYADTNEPVDWDTVDKINSATWACHVQTDWQQADVFMLDNYYTMHSRRRMTADNDRLVLAALTA